MATCNPKEWVRLYADDLFRFACSKIADTTQAQDLVQDTFLSALQAADSFRGESSEKTWLTAILKNKITDHYRKAEKTIFTISLEEARNTDSDPLEVFFNEKGHWKKEAGPKAWTDDISSKQERMDFLSILRACMNKLTGLGKTVFRQKYLEEKNLN